MCKNQTIRAFDCLYVASSNHMIPTGELALEYQGCTSNKTFGNSNNAVESRLPPQMPCFDRRVHAAAFAPSLIKGKLSRARSSSPSGRASEVPREQELRHARAMAQSMPNLHTNRSVYNRGIGFSVLSTASECGDKQGYQTSRARVQEFEALLEGL